MTTSKNSAYKDALTDAMTYLGKQKNIFFIGQQIIHAGNPMSTTLGEVNKDLMIELPVMEETQMGMSLGLAITGKTVVTFYPRWDFLISATNQLVNHLDKYTLMTGHKVNILIRLGKGSDYPLDPGFQHKGNYFNEFKLLCSNIKFHNLERSEDILNTYIDAFSQGGIHVLVEYPQLYYA
jgi:pyruvate/2-oxoglutarate/acetoin dehydrogenase E1 component